MKKSTRSAALRQQVSAKVSKPTQAAPTYVEARASNVDPDRTKAISLGDWSYCTTDGAMRKALASAASKLVKHGVDRETAIDILMDVATDFDAIHMQADSDRAVAAERASPASTFRLADTLFTVAPAQDTWDLVDAATIHLNQAVTVIEAAVAKLPSSQNDTATMINCATNAIAIANAMIERALDLAPRRVATNG